MLTEHVRNVLARLSEAPPPEQASTTLTVATPPLANTTRYDQLRAQAGRGEIDHA